MVRSLNSGVTGIQQFQLKMDVLSNNIANVNTTGYKMARVDFADSLSQTLRSSSSASGTSAGTPSLQIGQGVTTSAIKGVFTQGSFTRTGYTTDLAISGIGYFVVKDPVTDVEFVTRAGDFRLDSNGFLTNNSGLRLQGFNDIGLSNEGDILVDASERPASVSQTSEMASFTIDPEGQIKIKLTDGSEFVRGQILLQRFSDEQALVKEGLNLFSGIGSAGPLGGAGNPAPRQPGTFGLGKLEAGALELSNVELANEFSSLIVTQRAFQANARIISTSDEMLQELVNLKR